MAYGGTVAVIWVSFQLFTVPTSPLNATVLLAWVEPKLLPLIVTTVPLLPVEGEIVVIVGGGVTVKVTALLTMPLLLTVTGPLVVCGTITLICVSVQQKYQGNW